MNQWQPTSGDQTRRHSRNVALVFVGAVTVMGGLVAWEAWRRAHPDNPPPAPQPAAPPVSADRTYANNEFIPGVGYYHAPYHAWYPHPFNYYDPARGYFAGGLWQVAPFLLGSMLSSRPNNDAVVSALAAQRLRDDEERRRQAQARSSNGGGFFRGSGFSGGSSARPSGSGSTPSGGGSSISRGGFGSSGHSSGSS